MGIGSGSARVWAAGPARPGPDENCQVTCRLGNRRGLERSAARCSSPPPAASTIGPVPSTYKVRTAPLSDEHDVSEQRVEELRTALEAVGARSIEVSHEVTFELDAQRGSDAMAMSLSFSSR